MECVAIFLQIFGGLTPKSHKMTQGSAPVGLKNSPGPRNEVPDRFGEGRIFCIFSKNCFFGRYFFIGGNTLTSKIAYPEQNRTCHMFEIRSCYHDGSFPSLCDLAFEGQTKQRRSSTLCVAFPHVPA